MDVGETPPQRRIDLVLAQEPEHGQRQTEVADHEVGGDPRAIRELNGRGPVALSGASDPAPIGRTPGPPTGSSAAADDGLLIVPAPMLGTFYRADGPGRPPFVDVGSTVEPDTIVCIIEVMKMMNSIPAGVSGTVVEVVTRTPARRIRGAAVPGPAGMKRVFVANRGEIALRIVPACRSLGLETVVGASEVDRDGAAAHVADRVVVIGPGPAAQSYLRDDVVVQAALGTGCDAIHPGYGFRRRAHGWRSALASTGWCSSDRRPR